MSQRGQYALEAGKRFPHGRAGDSSGPGPSEMDDGLVPDLALRVMPTEREMMRLQVLRVECHQRLRHTAVEHLAAGREDPVVRHLTHPIVREVKALAHAVQQATAGHFLDGPRHLLLAQPGEVLEQSELELRHGDTRSRRPKSDSAIWKA
jgi:hypothetical protein